MKRFVELLESRRLMHGSAIHINFQPGGAAVPAGFLADTGAVFADRGNGFTYGWNLANTTATRDRNSTLSLNQAYDTLTHTQYYGERSWEIALPNGQYEVHLVAGDAGYINSIYKFNVENTLALSGTPTNLSRWIEGTATVSVTDGHLTITNALGSSNNKLCWIEIAEVEPPPPPPPGDFLARINFQPTGVTIPAGYVVDTGSIFADRGNGYSYGWSLDNSINTRDRNATNSPDQRYDTLNHFKPAAWELAVPNGTYCVRLVAGDAAYDNSIYKIDAEGIRMVDGTPSAINRWIEGTALVNVSDGRLTITNAAGSSNNKVCFIEVVAATTALSTVTITAPDPNAAETGPTAKPFIISRTGPTDQPLVVQLSTGGSASDGADYVALPKSVTIPAGTSSIQVLLTPIDDSSVESIESVVLTLGPASNYFVGSRSAATIKITDNDSASPTKISWTARIYAPVGRTEAMVAAIDNRMYVFGGYVDYSLTPSGRVDVYDPVLNQWKQVPTTMPTPTTHSGCAVIGRDVYLAGGYPLGAGGTGQTYSTAKVYRYNVDTNSWSDLPELPAARGAGAMVAIDSHLHFIGGADSSRIDSAAHWMLDLNDLAAGWVEKAPLPTLRNHLGATVLNGKIYAIGGQRGQDAAEVPQAAVEVYDPATDTWTSAAALPFGRSHINAATLTVNNRIFVFGGETTYDTAVSNVVAYDPLTNVWTECSPLPVVRSSGTAAYLNGKLYYAGGLLGKATYQGVLA